MHTRRTLLGFVILLAIALAGCSDSNDTATTSPAGNDDYAGIDLDAETIIKLAEHPNIIGLKDSSGNVAKIGTICHELGSAFQVLAGSAGFLLPALSVGAIGGALALANIAPPYCIEIYRLYLEGKNKEARELQGSMIPVNTAVTAKWGVPALKAAMDFLGLYGGPVRLPLQPISPDIQKQLDAILLAGEL